MALEPRVRVVSDGTPGGSQVLVGDMTLGNVVNVKWEMDWGAYGNVTLTLSDVDVEINQDASRWQHSQEKDTTAKGETGGAR